MGSQRFLEKELVAHFSILAWRLPMDRGLWQATVLGVTKSRTQLKQLNTVFIKEPAVIIL